MRNSFSTKTGERQRERKTRRPADITWLLREAETHTYRHANTERRRDRKNKQRKKVFLSTELEKVDIEGDGHVIHWLAAIGRFGFVFFFFVVRYCMCHHHNEDHHIASISVLDNHLFHYFVLD